MAAARARVARRVPHDDAATLPAALGEQLARLYAEVQHSTHVFASPLGPIAGDGSDRSLPRFVYFGPRSTDVSVRLAFYAGFSPDELFTTLALLNFVEQLATDPQLGEQLSLSFFPMLAGSGGVGAEDWASSLRPEVRALAADVRQRAYHGFVRFESAGPGDLIEVRLRTAASSRYPTPPVELMTDVDLWPFSVRWEVDPRPVQDGPLTVGDEAAVEPFELTLRFPKAWSVAQHQTATNTILTRFIQRYRAFIAYGQNL